MKKLSIEREDFLKWAERSWSDYATYTKNNSRVCFSTNLLGDYRVTVSSKELYLGRDFERAIEIFEAI